MNQVNNLSSDSKWENASLLNLFLAFFTPLAINNGKTKIISALISDYASLYMIRNGIAALASCAIGIPLTKTGYTVSGTIITGLFVVFIGLFSAFLVATLDKHRNSD